MSADNWRQCPRCLVRAEKEACAMEAATHAKYGTIPAADFLGLAKETATKAASVRAVDDELREDYELGVTREGRFFVSYGCACTRCGWSHSFQVDQPLKVGP